MVRFPSGLVAVCLFFLSLAIQASPAMAQDCYRVFLVGDAGDHTVAEETLVNLQKELLKYPQSAVVFLGDNSYRDILWGIIPHGFKGFDSSGNTIKKVRSQMSLLDNYRGSVFFIPGNHDWWNRSTYQKGVSKLVMEESFIEENLKNNSTIANPGNVFLPRKGAYGPDFVELNQGTLRIVFFDSYRIVQTGIKKGKVTDEEKLFYLKMDSVIHEGWVRKQKILVVSHHPVYTIGPQNRSLKNPYLFARIKASSPDFPSYREMISQILPILKRYPGIYYASGHLHALQYIRTADSVHYIISGAGSKEKSLSEKEIRKFDSSLRPGEYLLWNTGGFFTIDFCGEQANTTLYFDNGSLQCTLP